MNRRQAREMALQVLFQMTLSSTDRETAIDAVNENGLPVDPYVSRLLDEIGLHEKEIDQLIKEHLVNWSFDRIGNIDKTILRLAVCEMMYFEDVPTTVSINEAIELCRKYSDEVTRKFVNGVLSSISKEI
ncbi:transcription antitermination factor NusB [Sporolactobacillus shoreae]|uniref:Transcription antitermination protein NusB n=1 Tax=Sporolactobacillus shoreae TaxID=1465501 RepID=A0A4Z0GK08_9BACL|nr:transcription antitermination factor NusB [Sporolactobacillus shoreae]TGA96387.1 transcription antitermination factor NusB [Sporolactobacillus shoreae]